MLCITFYHLNLHKKCERGAFMNKLIKVTTINKPDGHIQINKTSKVTGKGQTYFVNKFLGKQ